jgi:hypothetical protein
MDELIYNNCCECSLNDAKNNWKFIQGVIGDQICEIGLAYNWKEIDVPEYTRQVCLLDIEEKYNKIVLKNKSNIYFPLSESHWGRIDSAIAICNGIVFFHPVEKPKIIYNRCTCCFEAGSLKLTFSKNYLNMIKNMANPKYKNSKFLEKLFK